MDLIFNKVLYRSSKEFRGDLSKESFNNFFGYSSRYFAHLLYTGIKTSFKPVYKFIIDTGAFISYAPDLILQFLERKPEFKGYIRGVAPQDDCRIRVKMLKLSFVLIDDYGNQSGKLMSWFALHPFDKGPFLLGMKNILESVGIHKELNQDHLILHIQ